MGYMLRAKVNEGGLIKSQTKESNLSINDNRKPVMDAGNIALGKTPKRPRGSPPSTHQSPRNGPSSRGRRKNSNLQQMQNALQHTQPSPVEPVQHYEPLHQGVNQRPQSYPGYPVPSSLTSLASNDAEATQPIAGSRQQAMRSRSLTLPPLHLIKPSTEYAANSASSPTSIGKRTTQYDSQVANESPDFHFGFNGGQYRYIVPATPMYTGATPTLTGFSSLDRTPGMRTFGISPISHEHPSYVRDDFSSSLPEEKASPKRQKTV